MNKKTLTFVASCAFVVTGCAPSPSTTIHNFARSVEKGNYKEARSYLSSSIKGMMGEEKLNAALAKNRENILECGGIKSIETDIKGEGEYRRGTYTTTYKGNCSSSNHEVKLIKEEGRWKIGLDK